MSPSRKVSRSHWLLALPLAAALGFTPTVAQACGGEWFPALMDREPDQRPRLIPMAEKALEQGQPIVAAGIVVRVIPHIRTLKATSSTIVARAMRVLAVAIARGDGGLSLEREVPDYAQGSWLGKSESARKANLRWAVSALSAISADKKDDPAIETELGEAMARLPELRERARERLERLAARDLVASPEGYATLARLRAQSGDSAGQKLALTRCKAMAKSAALCAAATESAS